MYDSQRIHSVHLELTSMCQASCPQCARNILGGAVNPNLPQTQLSLAQIKSIFPSEFLKNLNRLYMCGNYGDPILGKDLHAICNYFRTMNEGLRLGIHTNGSLHGANWWQELATYFRNTGDYVRFAIDGLGDTHALYRRGTDWNRIIDNAKSFIAAGGNAEWDFIVFRHNEHQVESAQSLAQELGFKKFNVKRTGRFFSNSKLQGKDRQEVQNRNGETEYFLEKPVAEKWQNASLQNEASLVATYGSMASYLDQTAISCKVLKERSIYVSAEGLVFPCCWTANQMYLWYESAQARQLKKTLEDCGGKSSIDATQKSLDQILESEFFTKISNSWQCESVKEGKLSICAKTCGAGFDQFRTQFVTDKEAMNV